MAALNKDIMDKIRAEADRQGVDPSLALAVAYSESGFRPESIGDRGKSVGTFQLQPAAAIDAGILPEERYDVDKNIYGGVRYLKQQLDREKGDVKRALTRYNTGSPVYRGLGTAGYADFVMNMQPQFVDTSFSGTVSRVARRTGQAVMAAVTPTSAEASERLQIEVTQKSNPDVQVQEAVQMRDPRTPLIDVGLQILGKTRDDYPDGHTPQFTEKFFESTMSYAEQLDPKLTYQAGYDGYHAVLKKHLDSVRTASGRPTVEGPEARTLGPETAFGVGVSALDAANTWITGQLPAGLWERARTVTKTVARMAMPGEAARMGAEAARDLQSPSAAAGRAVLGGAVADPIAEGLNTLSAIADIGNRVVANAFDLPVQHAPRPGDTLKAWTDRFLGKSEGTGESLLRGLAAFVSPFMALGKLGVASKLGPVAGGAVKGGVVDFAFTDPDSPFLTDLAWNLARGVAPNDPAFFKGLLDRYVDGLVGEDELKRDLLRRVGHVAEGGILGGLIDGTIAVARMLRAGRATKDTLTNAATIPPDAPPPQEGVTPGTVETPPAPARTPGIITQAEVDAAQAGTQKPRVRITADIREALDDAAGRQAAGTPPPPDTPPRMTVEDASQAADDLLAADPDTLPGPIGVFMKKTITGFPDQDQQKALIMAALRGTIADVIAAPIIETQMEDAEGWEKAAAYAAAFAVGVGSGRALRAFAAQAPIPPVGAHIDVVGGLPITELIRTARTTPLVRFDTGNTSAPSRMHVDPTALPDPIAFRDTMIKLDIAARNPITPLTDGGVQALAQRYGSSPKEISATLNRVDRPGAIDHRVTTVVDLTERSMQTLDATAKALVADGLENASRRTIDSLLDRVSLVGELSRVLDTPPSRYGQGLSTLRLMGNGGLGQMLTEGEAAGRVLHSRYSVPDFVDALVRLPDTGAQIDFVRRMTAPTISDTMHGAYVEALLGSLSTPAKAVVSNLARIITEPVFRLTGALTARYGPDGIFHGMGRTGHAQAGHIVDPQTVLATDLSPVVGEFLTMWKTIVTNAVDAARVGAHFFDTGVPHFMETGTMKTLTGETTPALSRTAFPSLQAHPNVAAVVDFIGNGLQIFGVRTLGAMSEATQFLTQRMELASFAYRAADAQHFPKGAVEYVNFVDDYMRHPPEQDIAAIRRSKQEMDFMQPVLESTGGFQGFRQMMAHLQNAVRHVPILRSADPFLRVATNVTVQAMQASPIARLSPSFMAEFHGGDPVLRAAAQGKLVVGTLFWAAMAGLGAMNIARGPMVHDYEMARQLEKAGWTPNSIDLWGTTVKLDPTQPLGFLITSAAAIGQVGRATFDDDATGIDEVTAATSIILPWYELMKNAVYVTAFGSLFSEDVPRFIRQARQVGEGTTSVGEMAGETLDDLLIGRLTPRYLKEANNLIQPAKEVFDSAWERMIGRLPWWNGERETDIFNRPRLVGGGLSDANLNNAATVIAGIPFGPTGDDPLDRALAEKGITIRDPAPVLSVGAIDVPLKPAERQRLRELMSNPPGAPMPLYDAILQRTREQQWKDLPPGPDGHAAILIQDIIAVYAGEAKQALLTEDTPTARAINQRLQRKGQGMGMVPPLTAP